MDPQPPIESVQKTAWHILLHDKVLYVFIVSTTAIGVIEWLFLPTVALQNATLTGADARLRVAFYIFLIPLSITIARIWSTFSKVQSEFVRQCGAAMGFSFSESGAAGTEGKLFSLGHDHTIRNVLSGTYQSYPVRIFTYSFTVGSGKQRHTYTYTVCEATGTAQLPDITLTKKQNILFTDPHTFTFNFSDEHIQLEGDFNKYFTLTVPKNYEQEAYEILTPDVMATLIDRAKNLNFEFVGNKIYVYIEHEITTRAEMQMLFDLTSFLIPLFERSAPKT